MMRIKINRVRRGIVFRSQYHLCYAARRAIEMRFIKATIFHLRRHQSVIDAATARHFQFQSGGNAARALIDRPPIGDHQALKAPAIAQYTGQQFLML